MRLEQLQRIASHLLICPLAIVGVAVAASPALAQDDFSPTSIIVQESTPAQGGVSKTGQTFGHSTHGEAFNEGPRQKAYLMKGIVPAKWTVATKSKEALKFFQQGVAQIHGYWYFEAERSFRQAAKLDPDCAMAYWGMAMANLGTVQNNSRAKEFLAKAVAAEAKASPTDKLWIDAYAAYVNADTKKSGYELERRKGLLLALKDIASKYPNEPEARAFYGHQMLWEARREGDGLPKDIKPTVEQADAELNALLKIDPAHAVHHYRIHLWDGISDKALNSAANCGPSQPAIAHMWHMCGHTYTALDRFLDAVYYQEASARVDHARMMRDRILPDQIHNYAHNNQWLIENLEFVGRARDAVTLAKNMIDLPMHPKYNNLFGFGSYSNGRNRLFETLLRFELWNDALMLDAAGYIEPGNNDAKRAERLRLLAVAGFGSNRADVGAKYLGELETLLRPVGADGKPTERKDGPASFLKSAIAEAKVYQAIAAGKASEAAPLLDQAQNLMKDREARLRLAVGQTDKALTVAEQAVKSGKNEVSPLATLVEVQYQKGKKEEARKQFVELQKIAGTADLDTPVLSAIAPIAREFGASVDWRNPQPPAADTGKRPPLGSLGPVCWAPVDAPGFKLKSSEGKTISLDDYKKRKQPVVVIHYLGAGCAQCMLQLQAFAPMAKEFKDAGIEMVAISTDTVEAMKKAKAPGGLLEKIDIPQLSDPGFKTYKAFRAYDDFEDMPLHGAYLIDGEGKVRWQDISFQPFKDVKFLLTEAKRLLAKKAARSEWSIAGTTATTTHRQSVSP
jgi:peroxiredoxin/tetratricopeptide (TPR) repeat protein